MLTCYSLFTAENIETDDYLKEGDVGFKKPRVREGAFDAESYSSFRVQTKKKRPLRRAPAQSDLDVLNGDDAMQLDEKPIAPRPRDLDTNFVDDDELQAALARSRRAKIHNTKKFSPEEVAKRSTSWTLFCRVHFTNLLISQLRRNEPRRKPLPKPRLKLRMRKKMVMAR
jgi:hypothetical protein